jgi:hypothetical protein
MTSSRGTQASGTVRGSPLLAPVVVSISTGTMPLLSRNRPPDSRCTSLSSGVMIGGASLANTGLPATFCTTRPTGPSTRRVGIVSSLS